MSSRLNLLFCAVLAGRAPACQSRTSLTPRPYQAAQRRKGALVQTRMIAPSQSPPSLSSPARGTSSLHSRSQSHPHPVTQTETDSDTVYIASYPSYLSFFRLMQV